MSEPPARPKIYHITHVDNLPPIIAGGELLCDTVLTGRGGPATAIGYQELKHDRLALSVKCYPGDAVSDYVPFYFCPRSVMLYIFWMNNNSKLTYRGGQRPIVHLEADLHEAVAWGETQQRRWAFTTSNATTRYAEFYADVAHLRAINWNAVYAKVWKDSDVRDAKQAEFLMHRAFPWSLVRRIGVESARVEARVKEAITRRDNMPVIEIRREWYYP